jgi:hypothetical protein
MRIARVDPKTLEPHPELTPPKDAILDYLLGRALEGQIYLYFAQIPLRMIEPFDISFDPRKHSLGRQLVDAHLSQGQRGQMSYMWVYPRDGKFIMSDNYVTYYACVEGGPEVVPCWVLGEPYAGVEQAQGPIDPKDVRKIMFGE